MSTTPTAMAKDCDAINARIDALGKLLDEREERTKDRFHAMDRMTQAAFTSSEKAIEKADAANQRHFSQINEFRAALEDQTKKYLEKTVYDSQHTYLNVRIEDASNRIVEIEKRLTGMVAASNSQSRITQLIIGGIIALTTPSVALIVYLLGKH